MEDNSYGLSSSDNEPTDTNLLIVLLRTVYVLFQNNASSSIIYTRNLTHKDYIDAKKLRIRHYFPE